MKVTQVIVTVHEKRNHPHEFGHYDCSITLTAEVGPELEDHDVIALLRAKARVQVLEECDNWQVKVTEEKRIAELVGDLKYRLVDLQHHVKRERLRSHMNGCLGVISQLPWDDRVEWRKKLAGAALRARRRHKTGETETDNLPF